MKTITAEQSRSYTGHRNYDIEEYAVLELPDWIRMNQLIRGRLDLPGFFVWYDACSPLEQQALLRELLHFGGQAGGGIAMLRDAIAVLQLDTSHPLVEQLLSFQVRWGLWSAQLDIYLDDWLMKRTTEEQWFLLPVFVYYFGLSENRVFENETAGSCTHWWHRDLLDPRVVQDMLTNPRWQFTSPEDDAAVRALSVPP